MKLFPSTWFQQMPTNINKQGHAATAHLHLRIPTTHPANSIRFKAPWRSRTDKHRSSGNSRLRWVVDRSFLDTAPATSDISLHWPCSLSVFLFSHCMNEVIQGHPITKRREKWSLPFRRWHLALRVWMVPRPISLKDQRSVCQHVDLLEQHMWLPVPSTTIEMIFEWPYSSSPGMTYETHQTQQLYVFVNFPLLRTTTACPNLEFDV